ncbi:MAG: DHH family phosphoesterase, partial [Candidatus Saccharimonadales bacterium]
MYDQLKSLIDDANRIVIVQPENPDGDSLASALALEEILGDLKKEITLYCPIDMPKYLHYVAGWDRVSHEWSGKYDLAIIVDTAAEALLQKSLASDGFRHFLETHPVIVLDHHVEADEGNDLSFKHELVLSEDAASTGELIYEIANELKWDINKTAAENLFISLASDTL